MFQRHFLRALAAVSVATIGLAACRDNQLAVTNPNQPDISRVYGAPRDVETIISKLFQQMYNGQYGSADDIWTQTMTMSFESHSQLGNFGMGTRALIPRQPIDNSIGNTVSNGNFRDFDFLTRNARSASNAIEAMDRFIAATSSTGTPQRDARAKAFAYFNVGYGLGMLSLIYDSAAVIFPRVPLLPAPSLVGYPAVNTAALAALDSAIALAGQATGQSIPGDWLSTPTGNALPMSEFVKLARSMKARFRAGVARTPTERAAVSWSAVIADATNGIASDFIVMTNATTGWSGSVVSQLAVSTGWSQMTPFILGMADTSGAYDAWLATPLAQRAPFLLKTPDQRFPYGETRADQIRVSGGANRAGTPPGSILYFRNRPVGEDTPGETWGTWYYDNQRHWGIRAGGGNGPFTLFARAENDMLAAEGYLRQSDVASALPLINRYRVRAKLPAIVAATVNDQVPGAVYARDSIYDAGGAFVRDTVRFVAAVPGKANCVPRVPQATGGGTVCGNVFEAMKWEKRTETSFTGYAQWFVDSRGWGDMFNGTALEWPVPYQELFVRGKPTYTTQRLAGVGTYGF